MDKKLICIIFLLISIVFAPMVMAKENPYKNAGKATVHDIPVQVESDTVTLTDTAKVKLNVAEYTHTIGRVSITMKPQIQGLSKNSRGAGNAISIGDSPIITYEFYQGLIKEQVVLDSPETVQYTYNLSLSDWVTEELDLSRPEIFMDTNNTEIVSYPYTRQVTNYAKDSTRDIILDQWGNLIVTVNGEDVVVIPKPFATDATGRRFDLDFELDKTNKMITIIGDMTGAEYPVTIDPSERVTNGGFESGTLDAWHGWTSDSNPKPTLKLMSDGASTGTYYCRYQGNYNSGYAGYSRIYQTIDYTGVTSVSMAVKVFAYNRYDFVLSDVFWSPPHNYAIDFPGQVATGWVTKSTMPTLSGNHLLQFWTYGYNSAGIDSISATGTTVPLVASFTATPTSGYAPLKVQFMDTSTGSPVSWSWDFGDGSMSTGRNPVYTYTTAGTYTVRLTATNAAGSNTVVKVGMITVETPKYSATIIGDYQKGTQASQLNWIARSVYTVLSRLPSVGNWDGKFSPHCSTDDSTLQSECPNPVTKKDFGIAGGGLLNDAVLHYHFSHGIKGRILFGDDTTIVSSEVTDKWNNKNKWVVIDACEVLSDNNWGNALGTTHGIMGFETEKYADNVLAREFVYNAGYNKYPIFKAYFDATRAAYGKMDYTSVAIFQNRNQMDNDFLPGVKTGLAPDGQPGYNPICVHWHTNSGILEEC